MILQKEKYKAAVIGVGRIGMMLEQDPKRIKPATHFGMWRDNARAELVAICDNNPKNLEAGKDMLPSVETYLSAKELLTEVKPDIVSIATWKDTHYEMMQLAIDYGVSAIVCEKPIAEEYVHAKKIADLVKAKGIHLFINHPRRFDPLLYPLRQDLSNGIIGDIVAVNTHYVYGLVTTGTHVIDTLRFFLKDIAGEMKWVSAFVNPFQHFAPPDDPCADGFIGFENGLTVSMQSLNIKDYDIFNFHFYGRKGKVLFKNIGRDIEIFKIKESPEHQGFSELDDKPVECRGGTSRKLFAFLADNVIESLEGRATSLSTGEDSLKALEVLLAMKQSVNENGKKIEITNKDFSCAG